MDAETRRMQLSAAIRRAAACPPKRMLQPRRPIVASADQPREETNAVCLLRHHQARESQREHHFKERGIVEPKGVKLLGAWISLSQQETWAIFESDDAASIMALYEPWTDLNVHKIESVVDFADLKNSWPGSWARSERSHHRVGDASEAPSSAYLWWASAKMRVASSSSLASPRTKAPRRRASPRSRARRD
jgi:hypothetical protein